MAGGFASAPRAVPPSHVNPPCQHCKISPIEHPSAALLVSIPCRTLRSSPGEAAEQDLLPYNFPACMHLHCHFMLSPSFRTIFGNNAHHWDVWAGTTCSSISTLSAPSAQLCPRTAARAAASGTARPTQPHERPAPAAAAAADGTATAASSHCDATSAQVSNRPHRPCICKQAHPVVLLLQFLFHILPYKLVSVIIDMRRKKRTLKGS